MIKNYAEWLNEAAKKSGLTPEQVKKLILSKAWKKLDYHWGDGRLEHFFKNPSEWFKENPFDDEDDEFFFDERIVDKVERSTGSDAPGIAWAMYYSEYERHYPINGNGYYEDEDDEDEDGEESEANLATLQKYEQDATVAGIDNHPEKFAAAKVIMGISVFDAFLRYIDGKFTAIPYDLDHTDFELHEGVPPNCSAPDFCDFYIVENDDDWIDRPVFCFKKLKGPDLTPSQLAQWRSMDYKEKYQILQDIETLGKIDPGMSFSDYYKKYKGKVLGRKFGL